MKLFDRAQGSKLWPGSKRREDDFDTRTTHDGTVLTGKFGSGFLGIQLGTEYAIAGTNRKGFRVTVVSPNSLVDKLGIRPQDLLIQVGVIKCSEIQDYDAVVKALVEQSRPIELVFFREHRLRRTKPKRISQKSSPQPVLKQSPAQSASLHNNHALVDHVGDASDSSSSSHSAQGSLEGKEAELSGKLSKQGSNEHSHGESLLARRGQPRALRLHLNRRPRLEVPSASVRSTTNVPNSNLKSENIKASQTSDETNDLEASGEDLDLSRSSEYVSQWQWLSGSIESPRALCVLEERVMWKESSASDSLPVSAHFPGSIKNAPFQWYGLSGGMLCFPKHFHRDLFEELPTLDSLLVAASRMLPGSIHHICTPPNSDVPPHLYVLVFLALMRATTVCRKLECKELDCVSRKGSMAQKQWRNQVLMIQSPISGTSRGSNASNARAFVVDKVLKLVFKLCDEFGNKLGATPRHRTLIHAKKAVSGMVSVIDPFLCQNTFGSKGETQNEAFDCTKRFHCGRMFKISFDRAGALSKVHLKPFLLDCSLVNTSRSVGASRSFDIYYQLCAARPKALGKAHHQSILKNPQGGKIGTSYTGRCREEFQKTQERLFQVGIEEGEQEQLWKVLGMVLLIGNLQFGPTREATGDADAMIDSAASQKSLKRLCDLLEVKESEITDLLCMRTLYTRGKGHKSSKHTPQVRLSSYSAARERDRLIRELHRNAVEWLVARVNSEVADIVSASSKGTSRDAIRLAHQEFQVADIDSSLMVVEMPHPIAAKGAREDGFSLWDLVANYAAEAVRETWLHQLQSTTHVMLRSAAKQSSSTLLSSLAECSIQSELVGELYCKGAHGLCAAIDEETLLAEKWSKGSSWLSRLNAALDRARAKEETQVMRWFRAVEGCREAFQVTHAGGSCVEYSSRHMAHHNSSGASPHMKRKLLSFPALSAVLRAAWQDEMDGGLARSVGPAGTNCRLWHRESNGLMQNTKGAHVYFVEVADPGLSAEKCLAKGGCAGLRDVLRLSKAGALPVTLPRQVVVDGLRVATSARWSCAVLDALPAHHAGLHRNRVLLSQAGWGGLQRCARLRLRRAATAVQRWWRGRRQDAEEAERRKKKRGVQRKLEKKAAVRVQRWARAVVLENLDERRAARALVRWMRRALGQRRWDRHCLALSTFQATVRAYLQRVEFEVTVESACQIQALARARQVSKRMWHVAHGRWVVNALAEQHGLTSILHPEEAVVFVAFVMVDLEVRVPPLRVDEEESTRLERCRTLWALVSGLRRQRLVVVDTLAGQIGEEAGKGGRFGSHKPRTATIPLTCIPLTSGEVHLRCTGKDSFMIRFLDRQKQQVVWKCTQIVGPVKVWEKLARARAPTVDRLLSAGTSAFSLFFSVSFKFGALLKRSGRVPVLPHLWQERWCLLYGGTLWWFKTGGARPAGKLHLRRSTVCWVERDAHVGCGPKEARVGTCFCVSNVKTAVEGAVETPRGLSTVLVFQADSTDTCASWVRAIRRTVDELGDWEGGKALLEQLVQPPKQAAPKAREAGAARWHTLSIQSRLRGSPAAPWVVCSSEQLGAATTIQKAFRCWRVHGRQRKRSKQRRRGRRGKKSGNGADSEGGGTGLTETTRPPQESRKERRARQLNYQRVRKISQEQRMMLENLDGLADSPGTPPRTQKKSGRPTASRVGGDSPSDGSPSSVASLLSFLGRRKSSESPPKSALQQVLNGQTWISDDSDEDELDDEDDVVMAKELLDGGSAPTTISQVNRKLFFGTTKSEYQHPPPLLPRSPEVDKERERIRMIKTPPQRKRLHLNSIRDSSPSEQNNHSSIESKKKSPENGNPYGKNTKQREKSSGSKKYSKRDDRTHSRSHRQRRRKTKNKSPLEKLDFDLV